MYEIDEVVSLIQNGRWHNLEDVVKRTKLPELKTKKILEFLINHSFIDLDSEHKKVKMTPSLTKFLNENQSY